MRKRLSRFLLCACVVVSLVVVSAFATADATAATVIASMTTGLAEAQTNVLNMINSVVPIGIGVFAVTAAVRVGKRMFKISGGNGN